MLGELLPWLTLPSQEDVGPRWLHVLLPAESLSDSKSDAKAPVPSPKAAEEKQDQAKANDELKQWLGVQLSRLEIRLLEQVGNSRTSPMPSPMRSHASPMRPSASPMCMRSHATLRQKIWNARYETHGGNAR